MGSPLRVLHGNGDAYGYDEFGKDILGLDKNNGISSFGQCQPFGYTEYRYGTYFAQAREYSPANYVDYDGNIAISAEIALEISSHEFSSLIDLILNLINDEEEIIDIIKE